MELTREEAKEVIGIAMGKISMCWTPKPEGVFDSIMAVETLNQVLDALYGIEIIQE